LAHGEAARLARGTARIKRAAMENAAGERTERGRRGRRERATGESDARERTTRAAMENAA
jgi:hypothetical protein